MLSRARFVALFLSLLPAALFSSACSDDASSGPAAADPQIVSFAAEPAIVEIGERATLRWVTENAASVVVLDALGEPVSLDTLPTSGTLVVTPADTAKYVLEAANADGKRKTAEVTVTVSPLPLAPTVESFTVSQSSVARGGEVTLAWRTSNADGLRIADQDGRPLPLGDASIAEGSLQVKVSRDTVWTLTAKSRGGEATAEASVDAVPAPTATLTAPDDALLPGSTATLVWTATNADRVVITDDAGAVVVDSSTELSGSRQVTADFSRRFSLKATGVAGEATATADVLVRPVIERFAITTAGPVRSGDEVDVVWNIRGATYATLGNNAGTQIQLTAGELQGGTGRIAVGADGGLVLRAAGGAIVSEASSTVEITYAPRVATFAALEPEITASPELPGVARLSYFIDGAATVRLFADPGGEIDIGFVSRRSGTLQVPMDGTTSYRLVAGNEFGLTEAASTVVGVPVPRIDQFTSIPMRVGAGDAVPLTWITSDAASVRIEREGVDVGVNPAQVIGTFDDTIAADTTYVLRAFNRLGHETVSAPITVTVGDPINLAFTVDRPRVPAGQALTFDWSNLGGIDLQLLDDDDAVVYATTNAMQIAEGSAVIAAPATDGTHVFELRVANGAGGVTTTTLPIEVVSGPLVQEFVASSDSITLGQPVTFSWVVDDDAQARTPTLALTDDLGNVYDISGANPNTGTAVVTPVQAGATSFTLRASTPGTTASTMAVPVAVYGVPLVLSAQASPDTIDTQGGTIPANTTLSWTTQNGVRLEIFRLDADGLPVQPALHTTTAAADVAAGSFPHVASPGLNEYLFVVTNGAGATAEAVVTVRVRFIAATPPQLLAGGTVDLDWSIPGSGVYVDNLFPTNPVTVVSDTNAFTDISGSPTATRLTLSSTTGFADYTFPATFRFPYFGKVLDRIRVFAYGYISFNPNAPTTSSNNTMPYPSNTAETSTHLPVFWDSLSAQSTGEVWIDHGTDAEGNYVVVQWKNFQFTTSSYNPADLNFQAILRDNGVFEYRYGTMTAAPANQQYADGRSVTIGFQNFYAEVGHAWRYNPSSAPPTLANTSLRWDLRFPSTGSLSLVASESATHRVCAAAAGQYICETVDVVALKAGDLAISEIMATPNGDPDAEWVEIRNSTASAIDLSGMTLASGSESTVISPGVPLVLEPGDFAVLARNAGPAGTVWSYGTALTLDPTDSLSISMGSTQLDSVTWDASWNVPAGATLRLDPRGFNRKAASNDARAAWCESTELFDGANAGTPGTLGAGCLHATYDMDPAARADFIDIGTEANRIAYNSSTSTSGVYGHAAGGMPFAFPFFNGTVAAGSPVGITSSGVMVFGTISSGYTTNANMPATGAPNGILAPFWEFLYVATFSAAYADLVTVDGQNIFVVQWNDTRISTTYGGHLKFQAQMFPNGDINFVYAEVEGGVLHTGSSATVGIEDSAGTNAVLHSYNTADAVWPGQAIHFRRKTP